MRPRRGPGNGGEQGRAALKGAWGRGCAPGCAVGCRAPCHTPGARLLLGPHCSPQPQRLAWGRHQTSVHPEIRCRSKLAPVPLDLGRGGGTALPPARGQRDLMAINPGGFVPCLQCLWEGNDQFRCQYPHGAWQGVWVLRAGLG